MILVDFFPTCLDIPGRRFTESHSLKVQSPLPARSSPSNVPVTMRVGMHKSTAFVPSLEPYPYSLSTPHALAEANSTSTVREEQENGDFFHGLVGSAKTMELQYPSLDQRGSARPSGVANGSKGEKRERKGLHDVGDEMDADGEIDPDFIGGSPRVLSSQCQDARSSSAPNLRKISENIAVAAGKKQVPYTQVAKSGEDGKESKAEQSDR